MTRNQNEKSDHLHKLCIEHIKHISKKRVSHYKYGMIIPQSMKTEVT